MLTQLLLGVVYETGLILIPVFLVNPASKARVALNCWAVPGKAMVRLPPLEPELRFDIDGRLSEPSSRPPGRASAAALAALPLRNVLREKPDWSLMILSPPYFVGRI